MTRAFSWNLLDYPAYCCACRCSLMLKKARDWHLRMHRGSVVFGNKAIQAARGKHA